MADRTVTVRLQADDKLSPALAKASGSSPGAVKVR